MKLIAYSAAAVLALLGFTFIVGNQGVWLRIVVGVLLLLMGVAFVWIARQQPKHSTTTILQKVDLSGNVNLEGLTCRSCGGTLGKDSVKVRAGAVFVECEYCGAVYQLEEDVKW